MTVSTTLRAVPSSTRGIRVLVLATSVSGARCLRRAVQELRGVHAQGARSPEEAAELVREARVDVVVTEAEALDSGDRVLASALEANPGVGSVVVGRARRGLPTNQSLATCTVERAEEAASEIHSVLEQARRLRRRETMVRWLEREAHTDSLTGLNNRREFDEELHRACQVHNASVGLLLINVVGTGTVNHNYGEEAGDRLIRHAATGIMRSIRAEDTAARLGDDNFAVIVRDASIDLCRLVARRITHQLELLNRTEWENDIPVSVTFGLACGANCTADDLFHEAGRQLTLEPAYMPAPPSWGSDDGPSVA